MFNRRRRNAEVKNLLATRVAGEPGTHSWGPVDPPPQKLPPPPDPTEVGLLLEILDTLKRIERELRTRR
jgi:hypothetical protein